MSDFDISVAAWTSKITALSIEVLREAVVELCTRIVDSTPLDQRRPDEIVARGDWNCAIGTEPGDVLRNDPTGMRAIDGVKAVVAQWTPVKGEPFIFANYKPYIRRLEYEGWSGQAPSGMMGIHVIEWADIVREVARKHGTA
jgi:hypothetical protein